MQEPDLQGDLLALRRNQPNGKERTYEKEGLFYSGRKENKKKQRRLKKIKERTCP